MAIFLNGKGNVYQQIVDYYKRYITLKIIKPMEKLPSCRTLASELGINPNTVERAYSILEKEKYIITIPKKGVYYTNVDIEGKIFKGITSVGNNPTVNGKELTIETYILDFNNNIYEKEIKVYFIDRIRDEIKFNNIDELTKQLKKDKEVAENSSKVKI